LCYGGCCASMELWRPTSRHAIVGRERYEGRAMTRKRGDRENTGWRISVEAKRLLERLAERSAISQTEVLEEAIREKAQRERVALDGDVPTVTPGRAAAPIVPPDQEAAAWDCLRRVAEQARAGEVSLAAEEVDRAIATVRASSMVTPGRRDNDPEWRERFQRLLDAVRVGVPEEWTEEEIQQRVQRAVAEVRARRRAMDAGTAAVPAVPAGPHEDVLARLWDLIESVRARFADLTPEEIEREIERALAEARESRRAGRH
jgi:hypothetical protein